MAEGDKTEQPTPKRLKDARKRGEVAKSPDISSSVSLLIFAGMLIPLWTYVMKKLLPYLVTSIQHVHNYEHLMEDLPKIALQAIAVFLLTCLPFFAITLVVGFIANFVQVGVLFSGKVIKPDFKKLNPLQGMKQLFGKQTLMNLFKTLVKFIVVILFCYQKIQDAIPILLNLSTVGTEKPLQFLLGFVRGLALQIGMILFVLAIIDYIFQRYSQRKKLKMTKQEVKEEFKQMEGDPQVKSQRKAKYQAMVRNAIANVKNATVLITNPTHYAIALRYQPEEDDVPIVLAKGADDLAQRMKAEAKLHDIPMIENKAVARALYPEIEPGDSIPVEWYEAIAEIIALVYQLEEKNKGKL
ncbi:flagellar biosynthesis protein FlhB [Candidatus Enterococcus willemsii]|uniref:Flagellar biosynthetic protein FlhB n=1 Tax=Candidatus Enterococcus willemsii TaxID=1857215 RepID=A0ABQ6YXG0_9ENTE|nr:flagellar biosynthesis protein FlhB [Enterococcus sp. CU12B]KAF1302020.1 flagellar biosynthesis protein FlhB [Enterococcus sp. CU12B]